MNRKPSITTQLKAAKADAAEQKAHVEKLTKELASANSSKDVFYKSRCEFEEEIKQVHTLLDALPGSIPRQSEPGEYGQRINHALMTRIAAWLAVRQ